MRRNLGRELLFLAVTACAVLVPAAFAIAACPVRPLPPCGPAAFTGTAKASACERPAPAKCAGKRGPRGKRGLQGRRGDIGLTGLTGAQGETGLQGATGLRGVQGEVGAPGATGPVGPAGSAGEAGPTGAAGAQGEPGLAGDTGPQGATGAQGATGLQGDAGPQGAQGATGPQGETGLQGVQGEVGAAGSDGTDGAAGATGPVGPTGPAGEVGPAGVEGPTGPAGPQGETGPVGETGPEGTNGLAEYAYIYNLAAQTVPIEAPVTFDQNGVLSSGITHAPGDAGVQFVVEGIYKIAYSTSGTEPSQMALFLNGAPIPGTTYGSGAGTQQNGGQVIVQVGAGDVLTLVNHSSAAAVGLASPIGGTQASVNASLLIEKLG